MSSLRPLPARWTLVVSFSPQSAVSHDARPHHKVLLAVPPGWEARPAGDGKTFYIDHNTQVRIYYPLAGPPPPSGAWALGCAPNILILQRTTWERPPPVSAPPVAPVGFGGGDWGGGGGGGSFAPSVSSWGAEAPAPAPVQSIAPAAAFPEFNPNITPTIDGGSGGGDKWNSFMAPLSISSSGDAFGPSAPSASAAPPNEPDAPNCSGCGIKVCAGTLLLPPPLLQPPFLHALVGEL